MVELLRIGGTLRTIRASLMDKTVKGNSEKRQFQEMDRPVQSVVTCGGLVCYAVKSQVSAAKGNDNSGPGQRQTGAALVQAEIYDPLADTWTTVANLKSARYNHTATLLPDGRVLVSGGWKGASLAMIRVPILDGH